MKQTQYEKLKKSLQYEIDKRLESIKMLDLLPISLMVEVFPEGHWTNDIISDFEFQLPYQFSLIDIVKRFMVEQFPEWKISYERQHVWDSGGAGYFISYRKEIDNYKTIRFDVAFRTSISGTTCVLNKIGTKEVPVYEVVCSQEAAEEFGV